mmetsp:Transcript_36483/g.82634  ORF Transcript_36483/g.82634 Transcript_36483/m.82634 type:complete len:216 (+) Transcript_36483:135-782(+)
MITEKSAASPLEQIVSPGANVTFFRIAPILEIWSSVIVSNNSTFLIMFSLYSRIRAQVMYVSDTIRKTLQSVRHCIRAVRCSLRTKPASPKNGVPCGEYFRVSLNSKVPAKRIPGMRIEATTTPSSMTHASWPSSSSSKITSPALKCLTSSAPAAASTSASPISEKRLTRRTISVYFSICVGISLVASSSLAPRSTGSSSSTVALSPSSLAKLSL